MDSRILNERRIEIAPAHRALMDELLAKITEGKAAEKTLRAVMSGILQQGGASNNVPYGRSADGLRLEPSLRVSFNSDELLSLAAQQAGQQGQEN